MDPIVSTTASLPSGSVGYCSHPLLIIPLEQRESYLAALRMIRQEGTDEHLIHLFFDLAITNMQAAIRQKESNSINFKSFLF